MRLGMRGWRVGYDYDMLSVTEDATDDSELPQSALMNAFAEGMCNPHPARTERRVKDNRITRPAPVRPSPLM